MLRVYLGMSLLLKVLLVLLFAVALHLILRSQPLPLPLLSMVRELEEYQTRKCTCSIESVLPV
jgi:hypothetical protein